MIESKDKVVNFRVTNGEYMAYCRVCAAAGLNNLSEMVRVAMNQFVGQKISAQNDGDHLDNPSPPASSSRGPIREPEGAHDRRTVLARENGRAGKWLGARSAGKGN
jgi:hypothetical protein